MALASEILEGIDLQPYKLSVLGQDILNQQAQIAQLLECDPKNVNITVRIAEVLNQCALYEQELTAEDEMLQKAQRALKNTIILQQQIRNIFRQENLQDQTDDEILKLRSQIDELKREQKLDTVDPPNHLTHQNLQQMSQQLENMTKLNQKVWEQYKLLQELPTNTLLAEQKLKEKQEELLQLDREWESRIESMITDLN